MKERVELYGKVPPPGDSIPINIKPLDIRDDVPDKPKMRAVSKQLKNGQAGGASKIWPEDIKNWLQGMIDEGENSTEGAGDRWQAFVKLTAYLGGMKHPPINAVADSRTPAKGRR